VTGRKYVALDAEFFRLYFRRGERHPKESIEIVEGLPDDARLIGIQYIATHDYWIMTWESDEWDPTEEGFPLSRQHIVIHIVPSSLTPVPPDACGGQTVDNEKRVAAGAGEANR